MLTSKPELKSDQQNFQEYLFQQNKKNILPLITNTNKINATQRLAVYYNSYFIRLVELLKTDYPKLLVIMGDKEFEQMAEFYIKAYPSSFYSIRYFGGNLSLFLSNTSLYKKFKFLAEMAKFEWALGMVFDAADYDIYTIDKLQAISPEIWGELKFKFNPSVTILNLSWDTANVWLKIDKNDSQKLAKLKKADKSIAYILWRKQFEPTFRIINSTEAVVINSIIKNCSLAEICEILFETMNTSETEVQQYLINLLISLISSEIICDVVHNTNVKDNGLMLVFSGDLQIK